MIQYRRVDLGLGSADLVKLADACKVAADNRVIVRTGGDQRRSRVPTLERGGDLFRREAGHPALGQPGAQLALRNQPLRACRNGGRSKHHGAVWVEPAEATKTAKTGCRSPDRRWILAEVRKARRGALVFPAAVRARGWATRS